MRRRELIKLAGGAVVYLGCGGRELDLEEPQACSASATNGAGPFYKAGAPERSQLIATPTLEITGRLLGLSGCRPLAGAVLDIWHADAAGAYDTDGFGLRGIARTDAEGRYRIRTVMPGRYLDRGQLRPAHVHVIARTGSTELTTQIYFAGDPQLGIDPQVRPSLIATLDSRGEKLIAELDLVLS